MDNTILAAIIGIVGSFIGGWLGARATRKATEKAFEQNLLLQDKTQKETIRGVLYQNKIGICVNL